MKKVSIDAQEENRNQNYLWKTEEMKKVSIDAQEENRNQNYLWKTEEIKMPLAVRYNQNFLKKITWACCV